jgi:hypothetical protein
MRSSFNTNSTVILLLRFRREDNIVAVPMIFPISAFSNPAPNSNSHANSHQYRVLWSPLNGPSTSTLNGAHPVTVTCTQRCTALACWINFWLMA